VTDREKNEARSEMLRKVSHGVESAMTQCIQEFGPLVWSIVRRYVRDQGSAEDLVQEAFTDLWKSASRFNPAIGTATTFVGLLARRRAIDFTRKEKRRPQLEPLPESESLNEPSEGPTAIINTEKQEVREALKTLPEESRRIFELHFIEGLTHPEIVEKTGQPLGTVKTRLRRGLIELRNRLRTSEDNPT
jgi:RNA polymerase sigma-70 factor (ECF subfamily)